MIFPWSKIAGFFLAITAVAFLLYPSEYFRGMMHRRDSDRSVAVGFYKKFLKNNPYHKGATLALAAAYESLAEPEAAAEVLDEFYRHRPGDLKTGLAYLALLENSGRLEEARALRWRLYEDAKDKPSVARSDLESLLYACYQKAVLAQNGSEKLKALTELSRVAEKPEHYLSAIVDFHMAAKNFKELTAIFKEQARKTPSDIKARRNLIYIHRVQGDHEAALDEINAALTISSGSLEFVKDRVAVHAAQGRLALTLADLRLLADKIPQEALWRHDLADNSLRSLPFQEAAAVCRELVEKNPDDQALRKSLIYAYADRKMHAQAAAELEKFVGRYPDDVESLDLLVYERQRAGENDKALASLKNHLARQPGDIKRRRQRAFLLVEAKKFDEAQEALSELVERDGADQEAWWALIYGYSDRKMTAQAASWLEKYIGKFPKEPKAYDELAQSYLLLNDKEKAIHLLKNYFARPARPAGGHP